MHFQISSDPGTVLFKVFGGGETLSLFQTEKSVIRCDLHVYFRPGPKMYTTFRTSKLLHNSDHMTASRS